MRNEVQSGDQSGAGGRFLKITERAGIERLAARIGAASLQGMPGVADCAVFGIPDAEYGEQVCAFVQPQPGVTITQDQVRAFLREHVSGFKVPKSVDFSAELPREDSGKIFKRKLREPFWAGRSARI